jgi:glycosyltransferase involved in cell wall biosynthesis
MTAPVLVIAPHFPHAGRARDGQGRYVLEATLAIAHTGRRVRVLALRFGDDPLQETMEGVEIERVEPCRPLASVFDLYACGALVDSTTRLGDRALLVARETHSISWCHGYECGLVARALARANLPVVGVLHYLVAQESIHDLALHDDVVRREAFQGPLAAVIGRAVPSRLRGRAVHLASRTSAVARHLPTPVPVRDQLEKLHLERQFVQHAHRLVAVGRRFCRSIATHYPEARYRLDACHAGSPTTRLPGPAWPLPTTDNHLRVVCVGRPTGQKGWDYLLAAIHLLLARDAELAKRLQLVAIGGLGHWQGPYSEFSQRLGKNLAELDSLAFHNASECDHDRVRALLGGADLLLHPAVFEPFGLVLPEAMQAGCSVLSTNVDGPSEILAPPWGQLVDFRVPQARAEALYLGLVQQLKLSRAELTRRSVLAQQASTRFTWSRCAAHHLRAMDLAVKSTEERPGEQTPPPGRHHTPSEPQKPRTGSPAPARRSP